MCNPTPYNQCKMTWLNDASQQRVTEYNMMAFMTDNRYPAEWADPVVNAERAQSVHGVQWSAMVSRSDLNY